MVQMTFAGHDSVTEWLRWWTRNPLGSARRGSNPLAVAFLRWRIFNSMRYCSLFACVPQFANLLVKATPASKSSCFVVRQRSSLSPCRGVLIVLKESMFWFVHVSKMCFKLMFTHVFINCDIHVSIVHFLLCVSYNWFCEVVTQCIV